MCTYWNGLGGILETLAERESGRQHCTGAGVCCNLFSVFESLPEAGGSFFNPRRPGSKKTFALDSIVTRPRLLRREESGREREREREREDREGGRADTIVDKAN